MSNVYRLDLSYFGTDFQGWQSQPNGCGIQDILEKTLSTYLRHPVRVNGAARTDSGVHALCQVGTFVSDVPFDPTAWHKSLQAMLPRTIGIKSIALCEPEFDAIRFATGKAYVYRLLLGPYRDPFIDPFSWWLPVGLDVEILRRAAEDFIGRHDFTSFCAVDSTARTREREIFSMGIDHRGHLLNIWVVGDGFLKQMVRSMVGTLVEIATGRTPQGAIPKILAAKSRPAAGQTAPAKGLCLMEIFYDRVDTAERLIQRAEKGFCLTIQV